nr:hypothetical protein [Tanacetum cinerariifolium]
MTGDDNHDGDQLETSNTTPPDDPHRALKDKGIVDSGRSRYMTGNKPHLADYQEFKGGSIAFGESNGRITGKGKIKGGRFSWVYFLKSKDETTPILKYFIRKAKNQFNHKVKTIRSDNGTEFKNNELIEFYGLKGIKKEYSNARTPQQNGVAERNNMTLIEAGRTMLADSFLPTTFGQKQLILLVMFLIGCHVTILNTIDQLGKFDGKSDSGVGYYLNNKAFREELEKLKRQEMEANDAARKETTYENQDANTNSTNLFNVVSIPVSIASPSRALNDGELSYRDDPSMPHLEDIYAVQVKRFLLIHPMMMKV